MTRALAITAGILTGGIATFALVLFEADKTVLDLGRRINRETQDRLDDHRRARP